MDSVKNRGRGRFLSCFTSIADEGDDPGFISGEGCQRRRKMAIMFSASLKTIFFRSPLMKKLRNRNFRRDSYRSGSVLSTKSDVPSKPISSINPDRCQSNMEEVTFSDHSSSMRSASSVSSSSTYSLKSYSGSIRSQEPVRTSTTIQRPVAVNEAAGDGACNYKHAKTMCILVACLVALVFSGKAFAVVTCTTALLFWAPGGRCRSKVLRVDSDVDSQEYKKKVILEGLLERNRQGVIC